MNSSASVAKNQNKNVHLHRVSKNLQICFCQNFVKFQPILVIFGRKFTRRLKLYEVHTFSTSSKSCHHITV